ncbi:MAG: ubiquinone biosynthesis regulatory protein kinase UbiB [Gammaproteobacteria bacterium]|jgi:ubiquinone biosynthesis protein|nr:ubiquinone biosynthesis regulatory protein kinase UbiB [Gammaproteobacteria bacterium]
MIGRPGQILRLLHINLVLIRHGLDEIILDLPLFRPVRFVVHLLPWNWFRRQREPRAPRIRRTLEDLGPIFVKFGQILSTRRDLLPDDIAEELAQLQDNVPPFPGSVARTIVEDAYGKPLNEIFRTFDTEPFASASIAQVHAATLLDGSEVIVKVVRPGISRLIRRDVELMKIIAGYVERYWSEGPRLRPREVVAEYEKTIMDELDLVREASNASQLRRNFLDSPILYVPEVHWPWTRQNVMVMERIHGTPIGDIDALRAQGIDFRRLSERGVEIFFTQVFRHNFFHADMHPGNIFVSPEGQYIAVDFGIMGTLSTEDQRYLAENFLAFFNRDYRRVAELHVQSEWVPKHTRVDEFESAIRAVCEPIFERPLKDISFGRLLLNLFQTARRFDAHVQPQLVLLQKTLLNIEGLGRQLYPDLDLWKTAKPFLERWMQEHRGLQGIIGSLRERAPRWAMQLPELPDLVYDTLKMVREERLRLEWHSQQLVEVEESLRRNHRGTIWAIAGGALLICSALLWTSAPAEAARVAGAPPLAWLALIVGSFALVRGRFVR